MTSFATNGVFMTPIGATLLDNAEVVLQPDGKIIAAGSDKTGATVAFGVNPNLKPDGTLDNSFGTGGKVITVFTADDRAYAIALQTDGKIVVAGQTDLSSMAIARYNSDGSLDPAFDGDGNNNPCSDGQFGD